MLLFNFLFGYWLGSNVELTVLSVEYRVLTPLACSFARSVGSFWISLFGGSPAHYTVIYATIDPTGPDNWATLYLGPDKENACGGDAQSPIDIPSKDVCSSADKPLEFYVS